MTSLRANASGIIEPGGAVSQPLRATLEEATLGFQVATPNLGAIMHSGVQVALINASTTFILASNDTILASHHE